MLRLSLYKALQKCLKVKVALRSQIPLFKKWIKKNAYIDILQVYGEVVIPASLAKGFWSPRTGS